MADQRTRRIGVLVRACPTCGGQGTLRVKEVQDLRRWGPLRLRDREPYWMARCTACSTVLSVSRSEPLQG